MQLADIIREVSLCSGWQLTQKLTSAQSVRGVLIYKCDLYHPLTFRLSGHPGRWGGKTVRGRGLGELGENSVLIRQDQYTHELTRAKAAL